MTSTPEDFFVPVPGQKALPGHLWRAAGPSLENPCSPKGIVLAIHGLNDYRACFKDLGPAFAEHGYHVMAYDQRGFGYTDTRGQWAGEGRMVEDARYAVMAVAEKFPGVPIFLLGESLGGSIIAQLTEHHEPQLRRLGVRGAIFSAPAVWGRRPAALTTTVLLRVLRAIAPGFRLKDPTPDQSPSTNNRPMMRARATDPAIIKRPDIRMLNGTVQTCHHARRALLKPRLPSLVLFGDHEGVVPRSAVNYLLRRMERTTKRGEAVTLGVYPDGYHMLFRDLQGSVVMRDMLHWLDTTLAAPHAPAPPPLPGALTTGAPWTLPSGHHIMPPPAPVRQLQDPPRRRLFSARPK